MKNHFKTHIGRLRILALLEGISLLALIFIAMPLKYFFKFPHATQDIGMAHGVLFIFYVVLALVVASEQQWKFFSTTWKVLLASFIPFGTFYIDKKILRAAEEKNG